MNFFKNLDLQEIIYNIVYADNFESSLKIYERYFYDLIGYKFILTFDNDGGAVTGQSIDKYFSKGASVKSLFSEKKVFVLDEDTYNQMKIYGKSDFLIDYSISLDTMALSYLEPFIYTPKNNQLHDKIKEVFDFISRDDVFVDASPYILENSFNFLDQSKVDKIFNRIKAYEFLRNFDSEFYNKTGGIRSKKTEAELIKSTQEIVSNKIYSLQNENLIKSISKRFNMQYILLLIISIIQLKHTNKTLFEKMDLYFSYSEKYLSALSIREAFLARDFFIIKQDLLFFKHIQLRKANILDKLKNMTWDVLHFRNLEEASTFKLNKEARYFFPAILTFDVGFQEIIENFKVKGLVYNNLGDIFPFYKKEISDIEGLTEEEILILSKRYFSDEAKILRYMGLEQTKTQIEQNVEILEFELLEAANIS
ncbi:hypothetical protein ABTG11_16675 [Acinetobacter baumannii]|uniref:Uncharacterized protein n=2 Tax=Acinetobacter baumannii TaxID=470 RepID=A0A009S423_ACIBA|nr:hypothetical protein [Acinetobacter baumannii]EXC47854.1 hypothetical protein J529_3092 [Acinetobacter baumannii 99063]MBD0477241.1 hypothetical protein [Acinetobacter baumannii]MCG6641115.1 hypothetical protein [Acinetobacter baumannii]MCT9505301.1 hypothetical protein [Acinetobacter baumannii]MDC4439368.1 hypothetical protein [Acinetobacter baumannii]